MHKPKHIKKTTHSFRNSQVAWITVLVLMAAAIITFIACRVPGNNANIHITNTSPEVSRNPLQEKGSWDINPTPNFPTIPQEEEEGSLMQPDIILTALDMSVPINGIYSVEDLDHWEEVASTLEISNAADVLKVVNECRELMSYECYAGETLVQALAKTVTAEIGGLDDHGSYGTAKMEEAAVVWCILNRVDTYYAAGEAAHVEEIVKAPHQFAYRRWIKIHDGMEDLVVDVLVRWRLEKSGLVEDCGRVLPPEYLFFHGDGHHNHFRIKYDDYNIYNFWDWSLPDPYKEG